VAAGLKAVKTFKSSAANCAANRDAVLEYQLMLPAWLMALKTSFAWFRRVVLPL
jgi:hypothetical protein